ncbi:MAG: hypothetical protein ACKV2T_26740 [Kofleriaceae bacterium]
MGKSLLWVMLCAACANNVPADRSTGTDGRPKGAKELALEEGVGKQRDIVTYPGGDRIDWKKITLPEKTSGTLDLKMTYTTPRPHLKASFDVFDQWHRPVKEPIAGRGRNKSVTIAGAKGTYFVRVYAPRRTDAATYVIEASFSPAPMLAEGGIHEAPVPDPPRLPWVPEPDPDCIRAYDKSNPSCEVTCAPGSPPKHKGCDKGDMTPPPPIVVEPPPPPPPEVPKAVFARVMSKEVQPDGSLVVIIGAGSENGVSKDWKAGSLLRGDTRDLTQKLPGATLTIIRVDRRTTVAKLRQGVTSDVLKENSNVVLGP